MMGSLGMVMKGLGLGPQQKAVGLGMILGRATTPDTPSGVGREEGPRKDDHARGACATPAPSTSESQCLLPNGHEELLRFAVDARVTRPDLALAGLEC